MIEILREKMTCLYAEGKLEEALVLSRELDIQILEYYKNYKNKQIPKAPSKRTSKSNLRKIQRTEY